MVTDYPVTKRRSQRVSDEAGDTRSPSDGQSVKMQKFWTLPSSAAVGRTSMTGSRPRPFFRSEFTSVAWWGRVPEECVRVLAAPLLLVREIVSGRSALISPSVLSSPPFSVCYGIGPERSGRAIGPVARAGLSLPSVVVAGEAAPRPMRGRAANPRLCSDLCYPRGRLPSGRPLPSSLGPPSFRQAPSKFYFSPISFLASTWGRMRLPRAGVMGLRGRSLRC